MIPTSNFIKRVLLTLVVTSTMAAAQSAQCADSGFYLGGSIGRSNIIKDDIGTLKLDSNDTAFKFIAGFRPLDNLAVEASYVNFGKPSDQVAGVPVQADGKGVTAFVLGALAVGPVDLFVKGGLINWNTTVSTRGVNLSKDSGTDLAYGAGAQFRLGSLGFRGEYEKFNVSDGKLNMVSVGVTWTFL
jgi:hypothetical protein